MKPPKIGNINAAFRCGLYKNGKLVGWCIDTPNSVAYGMLKTGADEAKGIIYSATREDLKDRVPFGGWFKNDADAHFIGAEHAKLNT